VDSVLEFSRAEVNYGYGMAACQQQGFGLNVECMWNIVVEPEDWNRRNVFKFVINVIFAERRVRCSDCH
jgi:hypothetical protein